MAKTMKAISIPGWKAEAHYVIRRENGDYLQTPDWLNPTWTANLWDAQRYIIPDGNTAETARQVGGKVEAA